MVISDLVEIKVVVMVAAIAVAPAVDGHAAIALGLDQFDHRRPHRLIEQEAVTEQDRRAAAAMVNMREELVAHLPACPR